MGQKGRRVGTPNVVGEPASRRAIPVVVVDDGLRAAARQSAANWAVTQPDPEEALSDVLGALGLGPVGPASRAPGRCNRCHGPLPIPRVANRLRNSKGLCADCHREEP